MTIHWDKKPLKEVATIIGGSTPKTNINEFWGGDQFWVAPAELNGNKYISSTVKTITEQAVKKTHLTLLPTGTVLLSSRAPIGKVAITTVPMYCNQGFKNVVCGEYLHNEYVYYYLKHNINYLQSLGTGATFKEISKKVVEDILIPVPPINIQKEIASELDLLFSVIEKKNEQLKILDKLAESTFYEMFGVPAESTDTKYPIIDYANCIAGATPSTLVNSYWENGTIPWLSSGEVAKGRITETDTKITQEGYDSCSTRLVPKDSVLVAMAGQGKTRGTVGITDIELCTNQSICSIVINKDTLLPTFLYYQLKYLYNELRSISNGDGGRGGLNLKLIGQFKIMVPQIEKQSLFVEKAVFIEKGKLLIKESIKPLEQLLAKRMDKYFSE